MIWLLLLAVHMVGWVGFNLLLRRSAQTKLHPMLLAAILQTGIAVPALAILVVRPPEINQFDTIDYLYLTGTVIMGIALQLLNVKALQYLEASVFSVVYNLRIIFATILGLIFLQEEFVALRVLGGICILLAIFIVKQKGSQSIWTKGVEWGVAAALTLSLLTLFEKELANNVGFTNYFPLQSVLCALIMWAYVLQSQAGFDRKIIWQPEMVRLMVFRALSAFGFSGALAAGALISVANYISSIGVIFMVLFGILWLNERDYLKQKIIACAVAVTGLTFIFLSRL